MNRRRLMQWIVTGGSLLAGLAVAVPALVSGFSPVRRARPRLWQTVGPMERFEVGKVAKVSVGGKSVEEGVKKMKEIGVYVVRKEGGEVTVFSMACTDLACPVNHDPGSGFYYCPCHGGIFNEAGEPVAGPPRKPLHRYAVRVREGMVEIDLASVPPVA